MESKKRVITVVQDYYTSLEELRRDKLRLNKQIRRSLHNVEQGARQCLLPDSSYLNSSNKYVRYIGYGLTAWKTARTVNRFMGFFSKKK